MPQNKKTMVSVPPSIEYYGDIHISKAINPKQWACTNDDKDSPLKVMAFFLYDSWNAQVSSMNCNDDDVHCWVVLRKALSVQVALLLLISNAHPYL